MAENKLSHNLEGSSQGEDILITTLPVIQEFVDVKKRVVDTAKVVIKKNISFTQANVEVVLEKEEIEVTTVMINKFVDEKPEAVRYEGDTMIISELQEVSVVRLMLVKELHITRKNSKVNEEHKVSLGKEEITVERTPLIDSL